MNLPPNDHESDLVQECYAVVYTPKKKRKRFPENCVEVMANDLQALEQCDEENHRYPAKVIGPSRSSEGSMLYYLVHWL
ncbi:MAG: hypothetical protein HQL48_04190 [Gammaproteobacteria bacterium]|nr:hypothetical protein [Gammaproteobacteria bacterium]